MMYLSVCSGIEAATVAWRPLGWTAAAFSEIDKFACALLAARYPETPNLGDLCAIRECPTADLLVGGTPCQSFSVAGLRRGMADPRGNLALVYLGLVDRVRPRWVVWENVPGVLSSKRGRDFGAFLGGLAVLGYGFAYRVLDAQFFGLAQRRKRVFVVGHLGSWQRAAAVLLERSGLLWDPPPSRAAEQDVAATLEARSTGKGGHSYLRGAGLILPTLRSHPGPGSWSIGNIAPMLMASDGGGTHPMTIDLEQVTSPTNRSQPSAIAPSLGARAEIVAFEARQEPCFSIDRARPLSAKDTGQGIALADRGVRRLTPLECERLMGFPDHYTALPGARDTPRYRALGNSIAVPVLRWIGERIDAVDALARRPA